MTSQDKHVSLEMVKIKLKGGEIKQHNHAKLVSYKNSKIKCHAFYFPVPSQSPSFGFLVFTCNSPLKQQNNIVHWTMFNHFITPPIDLNIPPFSHITSSSSSSALSGVDISQYVAGLILIGWDRRLILISGLPRSTVLILRGGGTGRSAWGDELFWKKRGGLVCGTCGYTLQHMINVMFRLARYTAAVQQQ